MCVRKFWLATPPGICVEFAAETHSDASGPISGIRHGGNGLVLGRTAFEGLIQAALCNVAT
jgi:hypothetical protein